MGFRNVLSCALVSALMGFVGAPALAQAGGADGAGGPGGGLPGGPVVEQCVGAMLHQGGQAHLTIGMERAEGVQRVFTLDQSGAPEGAIVQSGRAASMQIRGAAIEGRQNVAGIAAGCVATLQEAGAPAPVIGFVVQTKENIQQRITVHEVRALMSVRRAVVIALNNDGAEEGDEERG